MRDNPRIQRLILEGNVGEIEEEMEKSVAYYKMQTMNQSLIALILNGVISKETALSVSTNPSDLDLELRKLLFPQKHKTTVSEDGTEVSMEDFLATGAEPPVPEGEDMAAPLSDFSKIQELQEIKKIYEESRDKHVRELGEKDEQIGHLEDDLKLRAEEINNLKGQVQAFVQEREKLKQQMTFMKNEADQKVQRLQERIQQLSAPAMANPGSAADKNKGLFKK